MVDIAECKQITKRASAFLPSHLNASFPQNTVIQPEKISSFLYLENRIINWKYRKKNELMYSTQIITRGANGPRRVSLLCWQR